jgi:hypothetical protein
MDGKFYDPLYMTAEEYFIRTKVELQNVEKTKQQETKAQPMTGRPLNEEIPESGTIDCGEDQVNEMHLRENQFNNMHEFDNNIVLNNFMADNGDRDYAVQRPRVNIRQIERENRLAEIYKNPITLNDYESLASNDAIKYDCRTISWYIRDEVTRKHIFLGLFTKHSIHDDTGTRVAKFIFITHMLVGINAVVITDDYIDAIALYRTVFFIYLSYS